MKYILLLLLSFSSHSMTMYFDNITVIPNFDYNFILQNTADPSYQATLMCQNFFQKFDFFHSSTGLVQENYITIRECEILYENIITCIEDAGHKCVNLNDTFNLNCECSQAKK